MAISRPSTVSSDWRPPGISGGVPFRIFRCMNHAYEANVLGAFGLVLADRLAAAAERVGGASAAGALVTLYGTRAAARIDGVAAITGLSHSGAVRLVDRLAADGLVERRRGADHRSAALHLTPAGRRTARRLLAERERAMHSVLSLLTPDQQGLLARIAADLLGQLSSSPEAEGRLCRLCDLEACGRSRGRCPVAPPRTRRAVVQQY
jgi:MarR family transcriptional regulator, negative regulator of the multidrug operon emrRAB